MVTIFAVLAMIGFPLTAHADESGNTGTQAKQTITIEHSTLVVTASSGFHMKVVIANNDGSPTPAGSLNLSTNALFTFISRSDIQYWAEGNAPIPTTNDLGSVDVPAIAAGGTATVSVDVPAEQQTLAAIATWGPKPLLISYSANGQPLANLHSFLTRSSDGLNAAQTPAMNLTVAMPLTSNNWQVDNTALDTMISDTAGTSGTDTNGQDTKDSKNSKNVSHTTTVTDTKIKQPITLSDQETNTLRAVEQIAAKHRTLQVVADPLYLRDTSTTLAATGVMQPADFDITAYAALQDDKAYQQAGVSNEQWNAEQAQSLYTSTGGTSATTAYAWQGTGRWTLDALTKARSQGYSTVIADASFDEDKSSTVHTGTYVVNTDAGDITVLKEQSELGTLAHGQPTSSNAEAESSDAGRLARLLAQSAFYQMEQPYTTRNLLMTFSRNSSPAWIDQVMSALEQAPWLNLTDLNTMAAAEPYSVGASVNQTPSSNEQSSTRATLDQLASSRHDIMRLATAILKNSLDSDDISSLDPQALARQDANDTAAHGSDPTAWIGSLLAAHDDMALHALCGSGQTDSRQQMTKAAQTLANDLLGKVSIAPSESVSVFSESAKMPVTVSNGLPYAVSITVNSITDSMQIVTSYENDIVIPAHSEAQVAFTIRVTVSGSATAHISLADRHGDAFGAVQNTVITSVLRISDASGFIIIGFAVLLGVVGLWRQFNRKKDPDE